MEGVKRVGAVIGGLLDAIEPVTAIIASAVWLGTVVTGWDALGCALIIGMIVLITLPEKASKDKSGAKASKTTKAAETIKAAKTVKAARTAKEPVICRDKIRYDKRELQQR